MNKTAIKNFAIWARKKLIEDITYKAGLIGVSAKGIAQPLPQSSGDLQFFDIGTKEYAKVSGKEIEQRNALVKALQDKEKTSDYKTAFNSVIEEIAYTWFNRMIAVRFMEVNGYLPSGIRVLSSENPAKNEPDFVTNPFDTDMEFSAEEQDRIIVLKDENKLDELFRMLFIKQCNKLHEILPELFEKTSDYTELLLNISFADKDGVVYHLIHDINEDDFNVEKEGQVEIIGWMYQYYNSELKEEAFALLKKNIKINKERVPAATQIFTPDWIVKYMVENSLGRLWLEGHENSELRNKWLYYTQEAQQLVDTDNVIVKLKSESAKIEPETISFLDPCMGSGHILVYAFDVFMAIYESCGYTSREAAKLIIEKNLFGLDLDKRAYQLSYFAVMMKGREYNRRIFTEHVTPNLYYINDSSAVDKTMIEYIADGDKSVYKDLLSIVDDLRYAKEYGSLLSISSVDFNAIYDKIYAINERELDIFAVMVADTLLPLIKQAEVMAQKYDVVATNPPYAGRRNLEGKICDYLDGEFPDSKMDLFSAFIERNIDYTKTNGFSAYMTPFVWLYLSSFITLRKLLLKRTCIYTYLQPEESSFKEAAVSICSFVLRKTTTDYKGVYTKLSSVKDANQQESTYLQSVKDKESRYRYEFDMSNFGRIPDNRFVFWMTDKLMETFNTSKSFEEVAKPRQGMATSDNDRFLRMWYEVDNKRIGFGLTSTEEAEASKLKWFPYNKGGGFRKWYGNNYYVLNYENDGFEVKQYAAKLYKSYSRTIKNIQYYFKKCVTWSDICGSSFAARACDEGFVFDVKGSSAFIDEDYYDYILALLNSTISVELLNMLNPSITTQVGDLKQIPLKFESKLQANLSRIAKESVRLSKRDWDSFETSWDFKSHPLVALKMSGAFAWGDNPPVMKLSSAYKAWETLCEGRFNQLKTNEEELNRIFIDIYGLQDELTPEVEDKDVTVRKADLGRDIRSLISYAVGCMLGRYSLDCEGLAFAGGEWNESEYKTFIPDADNCIPIADEDYLEDDIVGRFVNFIKVVYGEDTLEENLAFIANVLGNKGATSRDVIRNYFLNDFIKDHIKIYQKRPIYWMFDSGKQNGFKALVYMHRWNADTVGNLRVEYLHKMQHIYENEINRMQDTIDNSSNARDVSAAMKRKDKLQKQLKETRDYDAMIANIALSRIDIDLDDGVKVNYEKVQTAKDGKKMQILAKI